MNDGQALRERVRGAASGACVYGEGTDLMATGKSKGGTPKGSKKGKRRPRKSNGQFAKK